MKITRSSFNGLIIAERISNSKHYLKIKEIDTCLPPFCRKTGFFRYNAIIFMCIRPAPASFELTPRTN